ncbi:MAG: hypothetical protein WKF96_09140 [Solirubrobacteraceae bacterium]
MARSELSVVTVGLRGTDPLAPTLRALAAQSIADQLEIVVVLPEGVPAPSPEGFAAVRTVRLPQLITTGGAIAAGVHAATAPIVAYVEEHSWPRPSWAERLLAAHGSGVGAVSWSLENANPSSATSWVSLLTDFGRAVHPAPSPPVWPPPWHHTSYRRELLIAYGSGLAAVLEAEWRLHADLPAGGHRFEHAGDARSRHWNVSRYGAHLQSELRGARSFGASRVEHGGWGPARRLGYAVAAPLVWALRVRRSVPDLRRVAPPRIAMVAPLLCAGLVSAAAGEAWGYVGGPGSSRRLRMRVELDRRPSLGRADRARWDRAVEV